MYVDTLKQFFCVLNRYPLSSYHFMVCVVCAQYRHIRGSCGRLCPLAAVPSCHCHCRRSQLTARRPSFVASGGYVALNNAPPQCIVVSVLYVAVQKPGTPSSLSFS